MTAFSRTLGVSTPQTEPLNSAQVQNNAGGYVYEIDVWARLDRFLILGTEGGTYYVSERDLTLDNIGVLKSALKVDPERTIARIVDVSTRALAPKNDQAIFALAYAATSDDPIARQLAAPAVVRVCRTGTHMYQFAGYVKLLNGGKFKSGRALRRSIARYYLDSDLDTLALHAVKYRQREGWAHRDLLRLTHPKTSETARRAVFDFMSKREPDYKTAPAMLRGFEVINRPGVAAVDAQATVAVNKMPWEAVPDELRTADMWRVLLHSMPLGATVRQLATLTRKGVLTPMSESESLVIARLTDPEQVKRSRIHPIQVLDALLTYDSNGIKRSQSTWYSNAPRGSSQGEAYTPNPNVTRALNTTFKLAFGNVEPSNKRTYIGVDVSGSMGALCTKVMSCTEAAAALALVTAASEPYTLVMGFNNGVENLGIHGAMTIEQATHAARAVNGGGTDCALPMIDALKRGIEVDTFVVITDNETWAGKIHPTEALAEYRAKTGIPARLVVLALTPTRFSIADPNDAGMLDIAGFSTDVPQILARFSAGQI